MKKLTLFVLVLLTLSLGIVVNAQDDAPVTFASTQFNVVEETEKARTIVSGFEGGTVDFIVYEEGPLLDLLAAESETSTGSLASVRCTGHSPPSSTMT